jgi:alpha-L-rhamnosidase
LSDFDRASARAPSRLRVEHLSEALGIDTARPRFSWWLPDGAREQLAYRIRTDTGWDSGRVESSDSVLVEYAGPALRSGQRVEWQVRVWTEAGESEWSDTCAFELGLLDAEDWSARWIAPVERELSPAGSRPAMLVRGELELPDVPVTRARLYATAHGIYEAFVNGARAGDAELTPGFTEYRDRLQTAGSAARSGCRAPTTSGGRSSRSSRRRASSSPTARSSSPEPDPIGAARGRTSTPPT